MRKAVWLSVLFALVFLGGAPGPAQETRVEPAPVVFNAGNGHHYRIVHSATPLAWREAADAAARLTYLGAKGHLVTLTSDAERQFVVSNLALADCWSGAYQDRKAPDYREPAGGWRWITGEPWQFVDWNEGEPNHSDPDSDVGGFVGNDRWNDFNLKDKMEKFVVEFPTTAADPGRPAGTSKQQIDQMLTRAVQGYRRVRSYSATVEFSFKAHVDTLAAVRVRLVIEPPGRFRLEGRGNNGTLLAVSDGRLFGIARTMPGEKMQYLVRPTPGLQQALKDAFSLLIEAPRPPSIVGFVVGGADPKLWSTAGRLGELVEEPSRQQKIRSRINVQSLGAQPIEGESMLSFALDDGRVQTSELSFRYKAYPFTVRETHSDIRVNAPLPQGTFAFTTTPGAIEVDDLGEQDDELTFSAPARR